MTKSYIEYKWETYEILWFGFDSDNAKDETKIEFWQSQDWKIFLNDWNNIFEVDDKNFRTWTYKHYKWNDYQVFWTVKILWQIYVVYKWLYNHWEKRFEDNLWYRDIKKFLPERYKFVWNIW